jgi:SAM-dependent methyltransferase
MNWLWLVLFVALCSAAYAAVSGAPWVPTWRRDIERVRRLLDLKPSEKFVELGCGDGRVTVAFGRGSEDPRIRGPEGVGVELSLLQFLAANVRRVLTRSWNVRFTFQNAFSYDLHDADAVYMFLMPETYEKLRPKLETELKPGARVVSYVWPIQGWEPSVVDEIENGPRLFLYVR